MLSTVPGFEPGSFDCKRGFRVEKEISDASVAQLVRAVDWQLKDPGSNPGTVASVSFSKKRFQIL